MEHKDHLAACTSEGVSGADDLPPLPEFSDSFSSGQMREYARQAVMSERERCAEVCERMAKRHGDIRRAALEVAAENIRCHE